MFNCAATENLICCYLECSLQRVLKSSGRSLLVLFMAIIAGVCGTQVHLLVLKPITEMCDDLQIMLILEEKAHMEEML